MVFVGSKSIEIDPTNYYFSLGGCCEGESRAAYDITTVIRVAAHALCLASLRLQLLQFDRLHSLLHCVAAVAVALADRRIHHCVKLVLLESYFCLSLFVDTMLTCF